MERVLVLALAAPELVVLEGEVDEQARSLAGAAVLLDGIGNGLLQCAFNLLPVFR